MGAGTTTLGRRGGTNRRGSHGSSNTNSKRVFEGLSGFGVLEVIASFLSPADLVGVATVSADFCRASASNFLWRCHFERAFVSSSGASTPPPPGEDRRRRAEHQTKQEEQDRGRGGRRRQKQPEDNAADERRRRCRCSRSGRSSSRRQHRWRPLTEDDGGSGDKRAASPASLFRRSCSDSTCRNYSWREAFFRAHREKPRDLLRELLPRSTPSTPAAQQPAPPRALCIILVHGRLYDLTEFLPSHPGGSLILREHASTNATVAFER